MFYNTIKSAWLAGKLVLRPLEQTLSAVTIEATGLLAFKAMLLSGIERRLLAEFAQFDPAFIAELPSDSDDWNREQLRLVVSAIHRDGIPRFPASVAKLQAELPQRRYLS